MPRRAARPTNKLSIYLLKREVGAPEEVLDAESPADSIELRDVGRFAFAPSVAHPPAWLRSFFARTLDENLGILTASAKGVLVTSVAVGDEERSFAIPFGVGRHLLKEGVVEERFGLKVVLNSLTPDSIRGVEKTTLGAVPRHSREMMTKEVSAREFGIDIEQDLVRAVTGRSRDPRLGRVISGKDALSVSVPVTVEGIREFVGYCFDRYESEDYKRDFDWIDQIAEVRDSVLNAELSAEAVGRINVGELQNIWMAVPDVFEWEHVAGFRYLREHRADIVDDLDLAAYLAARDGKPLGVDDLKREVIFRISANTDDVMERWPAFRCLYAEIERDGVVYLLNNGKWYRVNRDFTALVNQDYDQMQPSGVPLPACSMTKENEYNIAAADSIPGAACMDENHVVHGGGHSRIEFCDILTAQKQLVHVKRYGNSSVLSHLFAQGVTAGELFAAEPEFRVKLNEKLPPEHRLANPRAGVEPREYEVVFGIISRKPGALTIPFFSKVSLRNARRRLSAYGYKVMLNKISMAE
jgi:uncharacterized protein (TIGR04141 family)